ncbi:MAG: zf-TFIIB domain-containing protein [Candidatus Thermoplasmatota archaeon]|nr:zf-TFIIB domain-containing protein [Candidatus Thermoplasmatota archaeon]
MIRSSKKCPRCDVNLHIVERNGEKLDICTECGGVWFDPSELDFFIGEQSPVELLILITDSLKGEGLKCPECGKRMLSKEVYDVYVDFCEDCKGIWMDKGETAKVWSRDNMMKHPFNRDNIDTSYEGFWDRFKEKYADFE